MNRSSFGYATLVRHIGLPLLLLLLRFNNMAQPVRGIFYHLTTRNGLSSNRIAGIIQDRKGYYWIATQDGLNRFDGSSCKIFRTIRDDSNSISDNACVGGLVQDDLGCIWVGTQHGVNAYNPKDSKFHRYYLENPNTTAEKANWTKGIAKDNKGNIYICSYGLWVYNIYKKEWRRYIHDDQDRSHTPAGFIFSPIFDSIANVLWLKGQQGVCCFDERTGVFLNNGYNPGNLLVFADNVDGSRMVMTSDHHLWNYNPLNHSLISYSIDKNEEKEFARGKISDVSGLASDDHNQIWIVHFRSSTMIYSGNGSRIDTNFLRSYHNRSALSSLSELLFVDGSGNYWLGSSNGISIYDSRSKSVCYYLLNPEAGKAENHTLQINCLAEQPTGMLWIGTNIGLYQFDPVSANLNKIKNIFRPDDFIRSLYLQDDNILWIGGQNDLARFNIRKRRIQNQVHLGSAVQSVFSENHHIWVGTWTRGLYLFSAAGHLERHFEKNTGIDSGQSVFSNNLLCLSGSPGKSHFWIGYNGGNGYSRVSNDAGKFEHFRISRNSSGDIQNVINCIYEDKQGDVWIGTFGSGLVRYRTQSGSYTTYSQNEGLSGNYINAIQEDDSSRLWISTNNGLDLLDTQRQTFINTDLELDQPDNDLHPNCLVRKNGKLLFFARNRLVELMPDSFPQSSVPSFLLLNAFNIFDKEVLLPSPVDTKPLKLTYDQNFFSFEYSLLKPNPEGHVQYAYKLTGFDPDWNYSSDRGLAKYTNVPPGNYSFQVKAKDRFGRWSHFMDPVLISVEPPFWNTWWFISLLVIIFGLSLYGFFRYRINQVRRLYQLRSDISKDLHDQIGATLTSISYLSEVAKSRSNPAEVSSGTLDRIGQYSRDMITEMNDIVWIINPLNDSSEKMVDRIQNFATVLTAARGIDFTLAADRNIQDISMTMKQRKNLYLILKEAINNAAKHSRCSHLQVSLEVAGGRLHAEIRDNGQGIPESSYKSAGNGIRNMQQRAQEIGGNLHISSEPGEYTRVLLDMPITHNAYRIL